MRRFSIRALACLIVALMVVSALPLSVAADTAVVTSANSGITSNYGDVGLTVVTDDKSNLAPGVTLNEIVAYDKNGDRVEMYVTTADSNVDTVKFYANYKDNKCADWGLQTLSEQVAAIEANHAEPFTVVAGINASYYNTSNGKPTGAFVMEGVDVTTEAEGNAYSFFAVLDDGSVMIGGKGDYSKYKDRIVEAIGGYVHIVKDGAVVSGLDKVTKYPRQTLGITADGRVMLMTADGSQVPKTIGLTYQEQAEVMLAMGCVEAIHLDGGNSATFGGVREGTTEFVLINTPSGNVERAVSNTLCIVSTAVADGTFDHATISGEYDYFLPNSTYTFTAKGIDAAGGPANEIPADVAWALSDPSFGTITDGTFVSNGKLGQVDIQMVQNDKVVGSNTINVVNPTAISFDATQKTVPYGKTSALEIQAMYNLNEIYTTADAFDFTIANTAAGTMDGFDFTATTTESITGTTVTAAYKYADMETISVTLKFGKGSEIIYDFEGDNVDEWVGVDKIDAWIDQKNAEIKEQYPDAKYKILHLPETGNPANTKSTTTFLATEENGGKVKHGDSSLGLTFDRVYDKDTGGWSYNYMFYTGDTQVWRDTANGKMATKLGMWMYLPPEAAGLYARICRTFTKDATGKLYTNYDYLTVDGTKFSQFVNIPEDGWVYAEFDLTAYNYQSSLQFNPYEDYAVNNGKGANGNYYPAFLQFFVNTYDMEAEKVTIYIDDITLDYSDVTEDRHAPVISAPKVSASIDNFVDINGQTLANNFLSFTADVAENTAKTGYSGLDYTTAKIYIDGMDMSNSATFKCAGSTIALSDVYLNDGTHSIVFEIADKQGNNTKLTKTFTVAGDADNALVTIAGRNNGNDVPKAGSLYYIDVKASDAAQVAGVKTTLKLQTANTFEYEHITAAEGVEFTYEYDELNSELTLDIKNNSATGDTALVSIPVRVWAWSEEATGISAAAQFKTTDSPIVKIQVKTTEGKIDFADGVLDSKYVSGFYGTIDVATEVDDKTTVLWHEHTATAVADVAATCTDAGFEGRTYCDGCKSIVDWGTVIEPTGHTYTIIDGVLKCKDCSVTYSGVYEGVLYENGLVVGGWVEDSFYVDGVKLTGVCEVDGYYYDFGEDGVCENQVKYTGIFEDENGYRYAKLGLITTGWQLIGTDWYYFDPSTTIAASGELKLGVITFEFEENGKLVSGVWAPTLYGNRYYYGPDYYKTGWYNIDGKDYFFDYGYALSGGWQLTYESQQYRNWYYFNEDGSCDKTLKPEDGFYTDRNGYAYAQDGKGVAGLLTVDGKTYYFDHKGYAVKNGTYGGRLFKDDYAAYTGFVEKNGTTYYYENGTTAYYGLHKIDNDYYFVNWGGVVESDGRFYVSNTNCDLAVGEYTFGADGKLLNGIVDIDGTSYLYINGNTTGLGLYKVDDAYYYSYWGGKIMTDDRYYVGKSYCDLPVGEYSFGADGKMLDGVVEVDGTLYLYINGTTTRSGLYEVDGEYYNSYWGGVLRTDGRYYVDTTYCDLPAGREYSFGADGKMLNGVVEIDGQLYLYKDGTTTRSGLFEVDGEYYNSYWGGVIRTDGRYYVDTTYCDLPAGREYSFGADGKMLHGPVEIDGVKYLYYNGTTTKSGLYEIDGKYYNSYWGGVLRTDGKYYVDTTYCDLPIGNYEFDENGVMYDGIVEKDGQLYLYNNGVTGTYGLTKIGDDYYFVNWGGVVMTDDTYYVSKTYCDLPVGNYTFGPDGKMYDGFVQKQDGIYLYIKGQNAPVGLTYIDGYYYFVNWGAKIVTNQTFYCWETNGLSIEMGYTFDALGRAVL